MKGIIARLLEASNSNLVSSWRWGSGKGIIRDGGVSEGVREGARTHRALAGGGGGMLMNVPDAVPVPSPLKVKRPWKLTRIT